MNDQHDECKCYKCGNEITKHDKFIIVSMDEGFIHCLKCFIKYELVVLNISKDQIDEFYKDSKKIDNINFN